MLNLILYSQGESINLPFLQMKLSVITQQHWGKGLDYLFREYHDSIDTIVKNNLSNKHNHYLINGVAQGMIMALEQADKLLKIKFPKEKKLHKRVADLQLLYYHSQTLPDEVIFITLTEQFLRSVY